MFNSNGEFCVGETTLNSSFKVKVLNYEVPLPEINSFGPMIHYQPIKLSIIINWLERGLLVEFESSKEEEKAMYFVCGYNKYAKEVNDSEGKVIYKLAIIAQKKLMVSLRREVIEDKKDEAVNPFKRIQRSDSSKNVIQNKSYTNKNVTTKFSKNKTRTIDDMIKHNKETKEYHLFSNTIQYDDTYIDESMNDDTFILDN